MKKLTEKDKNKIIRFYTTKGWVKVPNFLNKKELKSVKKKINILLNSRRKKYTGRDINYTNSNEINSFHKMHDIKWVRKFSKRKKVRNFLRLFLNSEPELRASELFAKPKKVGLPAPVHQDNFYWKVKNNNALTVWVALCSSDSKNGGIFYYDGSHKKGVFNHAPSFAKGTSQKIKNLKVLKKFKKTTPVLKPGDALIHHVLIAHGSKRNKSNRPRRGWTLQYKDKKSSYDNLAIAKYEKSLKKQITLRNQ